MTASAIRDPRSMAKPDRERRCRASVRPWRPLLFRGTTGGPKPRLRRVAAEGYSAQMAEPFAERERTPTLKEAARRRKTLHEALVALEFATSSPPQGASRTGRRTWSRRSPRSAMWDQHVEHTEKPDGLYEEIVTMSPRLSGTIDRLRGEHLEITEAVGEMLPRLEQVEIEASVAARRRPRRPPAADRG